MENIVRTIRNMPDYIGSNGRNEDDISIAERQLGIKFAKDFRTYLSIIGLACFDGHEFTGICNSPRLNVVDVTICERENNPDVPKDWYVLEQANIDGIVIWQNQKGEVYQTQPCREIKMIANSIVEYISMKQH